MDNRQLRTAPVDFLFLFLSSSFFPFLAWLNIGAPSSSFFPFLAWLNIGLYFNVRFKEVTFSVNLLFTFLFFSSFTPTFRILFIAKKFHLADMFTSTLCNWKNLKQFSF